MNRKPGDSGQPLHPPNQEVSQRKLDLDPIFPAPAQDLVIQMFSLADVNWNLCVCCFLSGPARSRRRSQARRHLQNWQWVSLYCLIYFWKTANSIDEQKCLNIDKNNIWFLKLQLICCGCAGASHTCSLTFGRRSTGSVYQTRETQEQTEHLLNAVRLFVCFGVTTAHSFLTTQNSHMVGGSIPDSGH